MDKEMIDIWAIPTPGARLIAALDSDALIRGQWTDGHERACALAWMSREVRDAESADACPTSLMPQWAAEVVPWMDDAPSAEAWPGLMRRLGLLIDRATPQTWSRRLQAKWCRIAVVEALRHTTDAAVVEVCERVIVLLDRAIAGDEPSADEWKAAAPEVEAAWASTWAIEAAAKAAREAAEEARMAKAWTAWAAAEVAVAKAEAAREAAEEARMAKAWTAWAAREAARTEAAKAAAWAAREAKAASDRMVTSMLDALEEEIILSALEKEEQT